MKNKFKTIWLGVEFSNFGAAFLVSALVYVTTCNLIVAFGTLIAGITTIINLKLYINNQLNQLLNKEKSMVDTTYAQLRGEIRRIKRERGDCI